MYTQKGLKKQPDLTGLNKDQYKSSLDLWQGQNDEINRLMKWTKDRLTSTKDFI